MNDPYPERSYEVSDQAGTNIETEAVAKQIDQKAWDWWKVGATWTAGSAIVGWIYPPATLGIVCVGVFGVGTAALIDSLSERTKQRWRDENLEWIDRYTPPGGQNNLYIPPVVLDLQGSGRIDTVNVDEGLYFDYYGNGFAVDSSHTRGETKVVHRLGWRKITRGILPFKTLI
jgi:hypothetical protein